MVTSGHAGAAQCAAGRVKWSHGKRGGEAFSSMQGDASVRVSREVALGWRQHLLKDYTGQMLPPLQTLPAAYS